MDNALARLREYILIQLSLLENTLLNINLHVALILHRQIDGRQKTAHNLVT